MLEEKIVELIAKYREEIKKDHSLDIRKQNIDYEFIKMILTNPKEHPKNNETELRKIFQKEGDFKYNTLDRLKNFYLDHPAKREEWAKKVIYNSDLLIESINPNSNKLLGFKEFEKIINENKIYLTSKAILTYFISKVSNEKIKNLMENLTKDMSLLKSQYFLKDLISIIGTENGKISRDEKIRMIENELEDIRSGYEITFQENENLKEEIEKIKIEYKEEVLTELLSELNLSNYQILDDFYSIYKNLKDFKKQKNEVYENLPEEIKATRIPITNFIKFIESYGILQIETVGKIKTVSQIDIENYEYEGNEFLNELEIKKCLIVKSGWKYKNKVISRPKIKEILENNKKGD